MSMQAGWKSAESAWRELPAEELTAINQMLAIREVVTQARYRRLNDLPAGSGSASGPCHGQGQIHTEPASAELSLLVRVCQWS